MTSTILPFHYGVIAQSRFCLTLFAWRRQSECMTPSDISMEARRLAVPLQGGGEEHPNETPAVSAVPVIAQGESDRASPFWREVPVFTPYRCKRKGDGKSGSTAGTGEFFSIAS